MSAILTVILADTLIAVICNDLYVFFVFLVSLSACSLSVNNSIGLIDLIAYSDPLYCLWTIGNVDITNAVAVFAIQRITFSNCRYLELTKLFSLGFLFSIMSENRHIMNITAFAPKQSLMHTFFQQKTYSRSRYACILLVINGVKVKFFSLFLFDAITVSISRSLTWTIPQNMTEVDISLTQMNTWSRFLS